MIYLSSLLVLQHGNLNLVTNSSRHFDCLRCARSGSKSKEKPLFWQTSGLLNVFTERAKINVQGKQEASPSFGFNAAINTFHFGRRESIAVMSLPCPWLVNFVAFQRFLYMLQHLIYLWKPDSTCFSIRVRAISLLGLFPGRRKTLANRTLTIPEIWQKQSRYTFRHQSSHCFFRNNKDCPITDVFLGVDISMEKMCLPEKKKKKKKESFEITGQIARINFKKVKIALPTVKKVFSFPVRRALRFWG